LGGLTALGGLIIHTLVANFLQCASAKNCKNWLSVEKVISIMIECHCVDTIYCITI